jgi:hypothetical protein
MVSKKQKTYNEFTAKKYRTINKLFFCRRRKSNTGITDSNFELHLFVFDSK